MIYLKQFNPARSAILYSRVPSVAAAIKKAKFIRGATLHIVPDDLCDNADKITASINKGKGKSVEGLLATMLKALGKIG